MEPVESEYCSARFNIQSQLSQHGFKLDLVQLQAQVYPDKSSIQVMGVKQLKDKEATKTDEVKK